MPRRASGLSRLFRGHLFLHFTQVLAELICAAVDLDVPALDLAGNGEPPRSLACPDWAVEL